MMDKTTLKECIGNIAVTTTIMQFLSGILVCKQYVKKKTTGEASVLPFVCGALSCGLWLMYGLCKRDNKIVLVNTVGVTLMVIYIVVFYTFTFKKAETSRLIILTFAFFLLTNAFFFREEDSEILLTNLGMLACSLTLLTIAAPMSKLVYVIRVKSSECLPFPLILMNFFVCLFWSWYGFLDEDSYLGIPNLVGSLIALLQLSLFVIYPSTTHKNYGSEVSLLL